MSITAALIALLSLAFPPWVQPAAKAPYNFLRNGDARRGREFWVGSPEPYNRVEIVDGNPCFVQRSALMQQEVTVSEGNVALWVAFVGAASSEVIRPDGDISGRPYIWGAARTQDGRFIYNPSYQGQTMRAHSKVPDEWEILWGVFPFPKEATQVMFQISQGNNGKAWDYSVRFDDLALFVTSSKEQAEAIVDGYRSTRASLIR